MKNTLTGRQETFERHGPPPKKGYGCLIKSLIGIAAFAFSIVVAIWLIIMHSSLPLRFVTDLIEDGNSESNLKLSGVSGSLSSGLSFQKVTWNDGEITDMRFRYSGLMDVIRRNELIIHEMHVGSATLNTTFFTESPEKTAAEGQAQAEATDDPSSEAVSTDTPAPKGESTEPPLRLLQIDRVSLNQIIIKNPTSGHTITIPKIEWTGFKAEQGAELEFGNLEANSDHLVIKTTNPKESVYQKHVEISLLPKLYASIRKPIRIEAYLGQKDGNPIFDIKAFDQSVHFIQTADGTQQLRATGANLADFLDGPLPNNLQLDATFSKSETPAPTLTVRSGSFLLGTKSFEIQPTTVTGPDDKPEGTILLALHRADDIQIRYEIPVTETKTKDQSFLPVLTSTPTMSPEDLMALLFHNQKFTDIAPADQEKLRQYTTWFSYAE